jgi:Leucine-rich repeat (LRR) protein
MHLANNYLTALPDVVGSLRSLALLDLRSNQFSELPVTG